MLLGCGDQGQALQYWHRLCSYRHSGTHAEYAPTGTAGHPTQVSPPSQPWHPRPTGQLPYLPTQSLLLPWYHAALSSYMHATPRY
eukprot:1095354-Rhodomonas_salina.2